MSLLNWFKKKKEADNALIEEGVCPNCWGYQEYEGKIKDAARDRQIDINNHNSTATRAFIQDFVVNQMDGIRLQKDGDVFTCPACKGKYKTVKK